jgi:hypothetical protein
MQLLHTKLLPALPDAVVVAASGARTLTGMPS